MLVVGRVEDSVHPPKLRGLKGLCMQAFIVIDFLLKFLNNMLKRVKLPMNFFSFGL